MTNDCYSEKFRIVKQMYIFSSLTDENLTICCFSDTDFQIIKQFKSCKE